MTDSTPPSNEETPKKDGMPWWGWAIIAVFAIGFISNAVGGDREPAAEEIAAEEVADNSANDPQASTSEQEEVEVESTPDETAGERNARRSAEAYLEYSSFSRQGLIDQLLYEEFSQADAEYGVDALGADWNEQAALSAEAYLEYSAFSRQGLIDQLIYEGFSQAEAEYGVSQNGF